MMLLPRSRRALVLDDFIMLDDMDDYPEPTGEASPKKNRGRIVKISFVLLLLCQRGSVRFRLNLTEYVLKKDRLLLAGPDSICELVEMSSDCRLTYIVLSRSYSFMDISTTTAIILRRYILRYPIVALSPNDTAGFREVYEAMRRKLSEDGYAYRKEVIQSYLSVLYCDICHLMKPYVERADSKVQSRQKQIFDCFIAELQRHSGTRRDIAFYAGRLCLTPKYLSQVVLAVSGRYAKSLIRDYVILEAKALLKSGQYSCQQVSDILKFPNQSFFGTYFKRAVGCSPRVYQNEV